MSRQAARPASNGDRSDRILAWAEWIVAGLGAAFLFGVLGYMSWHALVYQSAPPAIFIHAVSTVRAGEHYVVRFEARNQGHSTAAGLLVEGSLRRGGETVEEAETTLDYVPARSRREGALLFENDPASFQLVLGAAGYHKP